MVVSTKSGWLLRRELWVVVDDLGNGDVVVAAGHPTSQRFLRFPRQRLQGRRRFIDELAGRTGPLARLLDERLKLRIETGT